MKCNSRAILISPDSINFKGKPMFLDLIKTRRSTRKFKNIPVEQEKINALIEAALRSLSSRGINPWHFIIIKDKNLLEKLSKSKPHGSSFLKGAPLGIVVCGDKSQSDVWVEDASIASVFIHMAAHDLGLGSCWIQIRKREHDSLKNADTYVKELLEIPKSLMVESIIAIGYPDEIKKGHSKDSLHFHKISFNTYGKKD
jgi:nitroreductase